MASLFLVRKNSSLYGMLGCFSYRMAIDWRRIFCNDCLLEGRRGLEWIKCNNIIKTFLFLFLLGRCRGVWGSWVGLLISLHSNGGNQSSIRLCCTLVWGSLKSVHQPTGKAQPSLFFHILSLHQVSPETVFFQKDIDVKCLMWMLGAWFP